MNYKTWQEDFIKRVGESDGPWMKPWHPRNNVPHNILTGKPYKGINAVYLLTESVLREDPNCAFATFRQAKELGLSVKPGAKGIPIVKMVTLMSKKDADAIKEKGLKDEEEIFAEERKLHKRFVPQIFYVFGAKDIEGYKPAEKTIVDHQLNDVLVKKKIDAYIGKTSDNLVDGLHAAIKKSIQDVDAKKTNIEPLATTFAWMFVGQISGITPEEQFFRQNAENFKKQWETTAKKSFPMAQHMIVLAQKATDNLVLKCPCLLPNVREEEYALA